MPRIGYRLLTAALAAAMLFGSAAAEPPPLQHGINITNWFRFPPDRSPAALRRYLDDAAIQQLKDAGFDFVRLPVQPELLDQPDALAAAVARLERHGLAVIVALHPDRWHLEGDPARQEQLLAVWRSLAEMLRRFDAARTLPEVLNEPVFAGAPDSWTRLQHRVLAAIRAVLPGNTVVLTGADWGGVGGLLALPAEADSNVIYSFHIYEPAELTALGAYRSGLDATAMARLPFPVEDIAECAGVARTAANESTAALIRFYCAQRWDSAAVARRIGEAGAWARRNHVRVIAGEFGASKRLNEPARLAWLSAVTNACMQQGIGWALWGYDDSMGFALRPPADRHLDALLLAALGLRQPMLAK